MLTESYINYPDHQLVQTLKVFRTPDDLHCSEAFRYCRDYLDELFRTPLVPPGPRAQPRLGDSLRIAQWNIEKGKRLDDILKALREHPRLSTADEPCREPQPEKHRRLGNRRQLSDSRPRPDHSSRSVMV